MTLGIYNGYIVNPTIEVCPVIRISPFTEDFLHIQEPIDKGFVDRTLQEKLGNYVFVTKARYAILQALSYYKLQKTDVVTILTTTNSFYISSCVTNEIEKTCCWSREITDRTKVLLVNHEFGYPFHKIELLKRYNLPIIEDCAFSFASQNDSFTVGKIGDFAIYSLPKFFPMQIGGILVSNKYKVSHLVNDDLSQYLSSYLANFFSYIDYYIEKRLSNYKYLTKALYSIGIEPFFSMHRGTVPGVFMFKWRKKTDYNKLKLFMQSNGVESSVFYGREAFFIPVHHNLEKQHLDYMINLLYYYNDYC